MEVYDVVALGGTAGQRLYARGVSEAGNSIYAIPGGGAPGNFLATAVTARKTTFIGKVGKDAFSTQIRIRFLRWAWM